MIWVILFIALILRLIVINQSFWLDEAIQVLESTVPFAKVWQIPADFHPPLFHYLAYFWLKVSRLEWWARLLPVFLGVMTIYLLYKEVKELENKKTARIASLLLATSAFHVYYSQEFRPYMLACFLATASYYFFIRLIKNDKTNKTDKWLGVLVNILGLYSLYYFPFVLLSQLGVLIIFYHSKIINWLKNTVLSLLFFLPWMPMFVIQLEIGRGWAANYMVWKESVSVPLIKALPLLLAKFYLGNISFENIFLYSIVFLFLIFISLFLLAKAGVSKTKKTAGLVLTFLLVPIFLSFLSSFFVPTIAPKRLLLVLPQFFFFLTLGIVSLTGKWQTLTLVIILVINIFSLSVYYLNPKFQREQWRQAVKWVEQNARAESLVLFEFSDPFGSWNYYQQGKVEAKAVFKEDGKVGAVMPALAGDKKQIFLFQYLFEMTDPKQEVSSWLQNNGYIPGRTVDFPGVGLIYEYIKEDF